MSHVAPVAVDAILRQIERVVHGREQTPHDHQHTTEHVFVFMSEAIERWQMAFMPQVTTRTAYLDMTQSEDQHAKTLYN